MTPKPTVILTRPREASERVAAALSGIDVIVSPVTEIEGTGASVDPAEFAGLILTSAHAVSFVPDLAGVPVYCVGVRTAEASGGDVRLVARDADDLVQRIEAEGPLLHARGRETRGEVAERLNSAGIETHECEVYAQIARDLSPEAKAALEGQDRVILPLWSPRSAERVANQLATIGSNLHVIALSPAVAAAWASATGGRSEVCTDPNGDEMIARIVAAASR